MSKSSGWAAGRFFVVVALVAVMPWAAQAVTVETFGNWTVSFYGSGETNAYETGEQNWTAEQIADVGAAINAWQQYVGNVPGRPIYLHAFWTEMGTAGANQYILGGSASYRISDGTQTWQLGEYVWKEGDDPGTTPYGFDTIITYDITAGSASWNFGSSNPDAGEVDFRSVVAHEIGHSVGFDTSYDHDYDDWGWFSTNYGGLTDYDRNLVDSLGNHPENGSSGTPGDFNELDNPVYWDGDAAMAWNDNALVAIYAPATWVPGSSLSHLDETTFPNALMSPSIATGQMIREPGELELAMMKDMGWTVVPEPATAMLVVLGGTILARRRFRRAAGRP